MHPNTMNVMAKKKPGKPKRPSRTMLALSCSPNWREWIQEAADDMGVPVSVFMALAVKKFAESNGFEKPMPRR
jgi:hypothetical protein